MELWDTVWFEALNKNKSRWRDKADSCDTALEPSGASQDIRPPLVFKRKKGSPLNDFESEVNEKENGFNGNESGVSVSDFKSLLSRIFLDLHCPSEQSGQPSSNQANRSHHHGLDSADKTHQAPGNDDIIDHIDDDDDIEGHDV